MGARGYNAGGYSWMTRVWCPRCGISYPIGHARLSREGSDLGTARPKVPCAFRPKCDARAAKKKGRAK